MITVIALGLAALAVLALAVGLFDAAQARRLRSVARERRAAWEERQRARSRLPR